MVPQDETPEDTEAIEKEKEKIKQRKVRRLAKPHIPIAAVTLM